jgi:ABC-type polysaccharide/polyol phosphate transport system ATPase subunit
MSLTCRIVSACLAWVCTRAGVRFLFVSHSEEDIRKICTRAICIDQHKVIADGSIEDVLKTYQKLFNA